MVSSLGLAAFRERTGQSGIAPPRDRLRRPWACARSAGIRGENPRLRGNGAVSKAGELVTGRGDDAGYAA